MAGISGARVAHRTGRVEKFGATARKQGRWIQRAKLDVLPKVLKVLPDGYVMEELARPAEQPAFADVLDALRQIWAKPAIQKPDLAATVEKVEGLCAKHGETINPRRQRTLAKLAAVSCDNPDPCLTHGDPTLENVMLRGKDIVICDPIPATPAVPDLLAVDLGKLLQSAVGWESHIRRQSAARWWVTDILALGPRQQTIAWCAIHLLRSLPYLSKDQHADLIWMMDSVLALL